MQVDFFIAGVQKGGTTALDSMLRRDPNVQMAARKELHFFDDEAHAWDAPNYAALHQHYDWSTSDVIRGEATPISIYWPNTLERIKAYNTSARIIIALRHPVYRAFSHWRMETTRGAETLPFSVAVRKGRKRVEAAPQGVHRVFSYVERSLYAPQIRRLLYLFPRSQVLFLRTDDFWHEPQKVLRRVQSFLQLERAPLADERRYVVPLQSAELGRVTDEDAAFLMHGFEADILESAELTGEDLLDWTHAAYREGIAPT